MTGASGTPVRPPAVAGGFYPADPNELTHLLEQCFTGPRGPGTLPPKHRGADRTIRAVIVPHAGYLYSGAIAAHAYLALSRERPPEGVLILGVNHHGIGARAALSASDWETPIGRVPLDAAQLARLEGNPPLKVDDRAHALEHSIEVELPFLQYTLPHPRFVALSVSFAPYPALREVASAVRRAVAGRDILLVASTDFSHYVSPAEADRLDHQAITPILARDARALYATVTDQQITMCGIAPTTVLLAALEEELLTARLLRWGHSGEAESMRQVVGYASLLLESERPLPRPNGA